MPSDSPETNLDSLARLGGSAFAATQLPGQSVGAKQLKKGAVTPGKLSSSAKSAMKGMTGATGAQGPQGSPGASARRTMLIDATGAAAEIRGQNGANLPLSGTTSRPSTSGQAGFLLGELSATQSGNFVLYEQGEDLADASSTLPPIPFAVDLPGTHTVTAKSYGGTECSNGSKIDSLHVEVAPVGT